MYVVCKAYVSRNLIPKIALHKVQYLHIWCLKIFGDIVVDGWIALEELQDPIHVSSLIEGCGATHFIEWRLERKPIHMFGMFVWVAISAIYLCLFEMSIFGFQSFGHSLEVLKCQWVRRSFVLLALVALTMRRLSGKMDFLIFMNLPNSTQSTQNKGV